MELRQRPTREMERVAASSAARESSTSGPASARERVVGRLGQLRNGLIQDLVHPPWRPPRHRAVAKGDIPSDGGRRWRTGRSKASSPHGQTVNTMVDHFLVRLRGHPRGPRGRHRGKLGGRPRSGRGGRGRTSRTRQPDASNLTSQVRNIATVTTAVANGDLTKKITVTQERS